jgi:hypothetical protein
MQKTYKLNRKAKHFYPVFTNTIVNSPVQGLKDQLKGMEVACVRQQLGMTGTFQDITLHSKLF